MTNKRSTYFVFQSLLTIVLLLFYFYQKDFIMQWPLRLFGLIFVMGGLLVFLALAPAKWLSNQTVQGAWFLSDVLLSSLTLYWAHQPGSDLYVTYFLVIFGTALTESIAQSFLVAFVATLLYSYSALRNINGIPLEPEFWLRIPYLWIFASFTAMLTRDSREARETQTETYKERLFHMERLAALGQISAEVAHRIKAPLTTIRVNAEVLAHQPDLPKKMHGELEQIQQEVDHCKEILQKLLDLGRIEELDTQSMDLQKSLQSALETIKPQLAQYHIQLVTEGLDTPAMMQGDPILTAEAILAVLQNSVEAMLSGGLLQVHFLHHQQAPWWRFKKRFLESYEIQIEDNGVGIAPTQLETIFRPFFTTKEGKGSGLGLSAALRIVDKHGGTIKATSHGLGQGACIKLTFPKVNYTPSNTTYTH